MDKAENVSHFTMSSRERVPTRDRLSRIGRISRVLVMRLFIPALVVLSGCTSFTNVRSAIVRPGTSFDLQASLASSPGDAAGWLLGNNIDCVQRCRGAILGGEAGVTRGFVRDSAPSFTAGVGVTGLVPYAEGYLQLTHGEQPVGIGARLGIAGRSREMGQIYLRYDHRLASGRRLLWNPAVLYASSTSDAASATFIGLVNALGLETSDGGDGITPSLAFVLARARHDVFGTAEGPTVAAFVVAGLRVRFGQGKGSRSER